MKAAGRTMMTSLLYEMASEKFKCSIEDIALVIPHPKHSMPKRFLKRQMLGTMFRNSVGSTLRRRRADMTTEMRAIRSPSLAMCCIARPYSLSGFPFASFAIEPVRIIIPSINPQIHEAIEVIPQVTKPRSASTSCATPIGM